MAIGRAAVERTLSFVLYREGEGFVARCLDVNVASEGGTEAEATANLREALELYFEDAVDEVPSVSDARVDHLTLRSA
jgi:predicted RNase H-like HicB family nuclease